MVRGTRAEPIECVLRLCVRRDAYRDEVYV